MEFAILSALVLIVIGVGIVTRLRNSRHRKSAAETKNIYPLW